MQLKDSIIWQMSNGLRGHFEDIPLSEDYQKAKQETVEKMEALEEKLKKYPELYTLYKEVLDATDNEYFIYADDVYREAFALGLAIGREVFETSLLRSR